MFGLGRKKKRSEGTASTFVEATGGGWDSPPGAVPLDGGKHADYVGDILRRAQQHAAQAGIAIGEDFKFTITDIPRGISSPHEILFGVMGRAHDYGLSAGAVMDETVYFTRME